MKKRKPIILNKLLHHFVNFKTLQNIHQTKTNGFDMTCKRITIVSKKVKIYKQLSKTLLSEVYSKIRNITL